MKPLTTVDGKLRACTNLAAKSVALAQSRASVGNLSSASRTHFGEPFLVLVEILTVINCNASVGAGFGGAPECAGIDWDRPSIAGAHVSRYGTRTR